MLNNQIRIGAVYVTRKVDRQIRNGEMDAGQFKGLLKDLNHVLRQDKFEVFNFVTRYGISPRKNKPLSLFKRFTTTLRFRLRKFWGNVKRFFNVDKNAYFVADQQKAKAEQATKAYTLMINQELEQIEKLLKQAKETGHPVETLHPEGLTEDKLIDLKQGLEAGRRNIDGLMGAARMFDDEARKVLSGVDYSKFITAQQVIYNSRVFRTWEGVIEQKTGQDGKTFYTLDPDKFGELPNLSQRQLGNYFEMIELLQDHLASQPDLRKQLDSLLDLIQPDSKLSARFAHAVKFGPETGAIHKFTNPVRDALYYRSPVNDPAP